MITFSRLGRMGNLGNQLFQIATTIGLSKKYNHSYCFPQWKYEKYFYNKFISSPNVEVKFFPLLEKYYHFHEWKIGTENYDLKGWLQSERYFDIPFTKKIFTFNPELIDNLISNYSFLFNKKNILVSVRRGDFVNNPIFYQLSYKYYFLGILKNFPDWKDRNIVFMSDNIKYCEKHFGFLENAFFIKNLSPIEQMALGTQFDDYVISNSTFSWWIAWLGEKKGTKIVLPPKNFRENYNLIKNDKDYFPERWLKFDHHQYKMPFNYKKLILTGEWNILKTNFNHTYKNQKKRMKDFIKLFLHKKYFPFFYKAKN